MRNFYNPYAFNKYAAAEQAEFEAQKRIMDGQNTANQLRRAAETQRAMQAASAAAAPGLMAEASQVREDSYNDMENAVADYPYDRYAPMGLPSTLPGFDLATQLQPPVMPTEAPTPVGAPMVAPGAAMTPEAAAGWDPRLLQAAKVLGGGALGAGLGYGLGSLYDQGGYGALAGGALGALAGGVVGPLSEAYLSDEVKTAAYNEAIMQSYLAQQAVARKEAHLRNIFIQDYLNN